MRRLFTLIQLAVCCQVINAQDTYNPFIEEGKTFAIAEYDYSQICMWDNVYRLRFGIDTIIEGQTYKQMEGLNYTSSNDCPPFSAGTWGELNEFIREDIQERKVFYRDVNSETDKLLFDLSLEIGDTLVNDLILNDFYIVDTIVDYQLLNGTTVKKFIFEEIVANNELFFYIEGIGSSSGVLNDFGDGIGFGAQLLCVDMDSELVYDGNCSGFVLGTDNESQEFIRVYPNPADDFINISFSSETPLNAQILDATGKIVRSVQLNNSPQRMDLTGFNSGIYFIVLQNASTNYSVQKFAVR